MMIEVTILSTCYMLFLVDDDYVLHDGVLFSNLRLHIYL
jgi:hypothetical protein